MNSVYITVFAGSVRACASHGQNRVCFTNVAFITQLLMKRFRLVNAIVWCNRYESDKIQLTQRLNRFLLSNEGLFLLLTFMI